jgi:hypothetical protein
VLQLTFLRIKAMANVANVMEQGLAIPWINLPRPSSLTRNPNARNATELDSVRRAVERDLLITKDNTVDTSLNSLGNTDSANHKTDGFRSANVTPTLD